jgi:serine/threonine-protein kinase
MADQHPKTIGRYEVLGVLGKGAMGVVYKAVDPVIDRVVAIKTIRFTLSEEELAFYEERFAQEIKTVGKLNHPHVVTIYDVGRTEEFAYMAMEFIEGPELKQLMGGKPLDVATSVDLIAQTAEGLAFAHARDIVHRDVKPSNVMIVNDEDGMTAKITDFGIARAPSSKVKTMTGMILGSPRYMSPEQVVGKNVGPRSDIFSLGVVLYEMLAGVAPFDADSVSSIMYQTVHVREEPLRNVNVEVPEALDAIVTRALAKAQEDRYATMKDFARALREAAKSLPAPQPRLPLAPAPAARPATLPPTPEAVMSATQGTGESPEAPLAKTQDGLSVSLSFDSTAATMKLAAITDTAIDATRIARPPIAPEPEPEMEPEPVPQPAIVEIASGVIPPSPRSFPLVPAVMLGALAFVAIVLGVALAM